MTIPLLFPAPHTLDSLALALSPPTANSTSPAIVSNLVATTEFADDGRVAGAPSNVPGALASGNAANSVTAIKNSNKTVSHACDSGTYVGMAVFQAGAFAGQIIAAIRTAAKAIQKALGISPSSSSLSNKLKKLAQWISDQAKFIAKITNALQQFISYVNAIKQFLAFVLSLPSILLNYFKDCISTLKKQLVAGFNSAFSDTAGTDKQVSELTSAIKDVNKSIGEFSSAVKTATGTAAAAAISLTTPTQVSSGNTQAQQAATTAVFAAAGFSDQSKNYGGKP
jgi:hypothetical protein